MRLAGLALAIGGWLVSLAGLFVTSSNMGRGLFACFGIAISLVGSLGLINGCNLANAIWKKS